MVLTRDQDEELRQACDVWIQRHFLFGTSPTLTADGLSAALLSFAREIVMLAEQVLAEGGQHDQS